jgi:hypothetical protein
MARPPKHIVTAGSTHNWQTIETPDEEIDVFDHYGVAPSSEFHEIATGVTRPKPQGWKDPTGYELFSKSVSHLRGNYDITRWTNPAYKYHTRYNGVFGSLLNDENCWDQALTETSLGSDSALTNTALISALGNLKNQKVNLGVAWGERNQTARLLGSTATKLAKSFLELKRGRFKNAAQTLGLRSAPRRPRGDNITKEWLALQYGWKPLLSDVYGAVSALKERKTSDWAVTAKGRANRNIPLSASFEDAYEFMKWSVSGKASRKAYCRIDAHPTNEVLISLNRVGVLNPLLIGWELVPFSFVVDWAWPIGNYLNSLDAMLGYGKDSWMSTSLLCRGDWGISVSSHKPLEYFGGDGSYSASGSGSKNVVILKRSASQGVPLPHLPSVKNPAGLTHMANGLSLMAQIFGKGRR